MSEKTNFSLPENAHRELKSGEQYKPLLSPDKTYPEVTVYSVSMGIVMAIIFSAAAAYLGLKVGQVFEAAIPIAILAVGITGALGKKGGLGQNVIIQSIGACSGVIVAGAIFTLPAIYILGLDVNFTQMFLSSLFGGVLGILTGYGGVSLARNLIHLPASIPLWSIIVSFIVCTIIGVIFGYVPARKAARMDPIEAIRYE